MKKEAKRVEELTKKIADLKRKFKVEDVVRIPTLKFNGIVRERCANHNDEKVFWVIETFCGSKEIVDEVNVLHWENEKEKNDWLTEFYQRQHAEISSMIRNLPKEQKICLLENCINEEKSK